MIIGALQVKLFIPEAQSLKEKRFVLKSILTRIRSRFNVSVSEIDGQDLWQSSLIGVVAVGNEQRHVNEVLSKVTDFLREGRNFEVIDSKLEFL
jgi:uncharacterized protein YlxP (DUF503 family)